MFSFSAVTVLLVPKGENGTTRWLFNKKIKEGKKAVTFPSW
jgi:hypothetical protein